MKRISKKLSAAPSKRVRTVLNRSDQPERVRFDRDSDEVEQTFNETDFFGFPHKFTSESFVGTGAIAFAPQRVPAARNRTRRRKKPTESAMARRRLAEESGSWFKEGPVKGDHQMDPPGGEGVAKKTPTRDTTGKQDTRFKQSGEPWPRKHKGNLAMGGPESHGQTAEYNSEHGEPDDGFTDEVGHDWPDGPANTGQGVAEPFDRTLEGTEMPKGTAPHGFGASSKNEGWTIKDVTSLMEKDSFGVSELQQLFDAYARETDYVCVENFAELCRAHGAHNVLDEGTLLGLMEANPEFVFHEMTDASGTYWLPAEPLSEARGETKTTVPSKSKRGRTSEPPEPPAAFRDRIKKDKSGKKSYKKKNSRHGGLFTARTKSGGRRRQKPSFLKSESADPNSRCRDWLDTAGEIRWLLGEGHVTPTDARRALQLSFNVQLSREHLTGCSRNLLESIQDVVYQHGLSVDKRLQQAKRLWEARYEPGMEDDPYGDGPVNMGNPGLVEPGLDDPGMGPDPVGDDGGFDEFDPAGDPGMAGGQEPWDGPDPGMGDLSPEQQSRPYFNSNYDESSDSYDAPPGDELGDDDPGAEEYGPMGEGPLRSEDDWDPGFDPSPKGDTWGSRAGGTYDDPMGGAMDHARKHGKAPTGGWQEGRRPGRNRQPLNEDSSWFQDGGTRSQHGHQMDQDGSAVGGDLGDGPQSGLYPEEDADMVELAGENLLGYDQENDLDGYGEFEHGGEGTLKGWQAPRGGGVRENLDKLHRHVAKRLKECAERAPRGKHNLQFCAVVAGDQKVHRAPERIGLAEALADSEELLLMYGRRRVMLEAVFYRGDREVYRERIALPGVQPRDPFLSEGQVLFRFPKHAERYAGELMREGHSCRVQDHNWGKSVAASVSSKVATRAFHALLS